jgi:hypothetical protein
VDAAGLTGLSESPDWLKNLGSDEPATPATDSGAPADAGLTGLSESPDWLNNLGAQEPATSTSELPEPAGGISFSETPDWLKDLGGAPSPDTPADLPPSPAFMTPELSQSALPAFAPEGGQNVFPADSLSRNDMESLFTEMPDWLAGVATEEPGLSSAPADQNVIAPGSLPSWVEAMRPVESSVAQGGAAGDQTLETRGPLAGLHGVLPAVPFPGPSSKPKVHSIKLVASEEQQAHAALLEEVLGAETIPVPIVSQRQVASQRVLRLATAILLFALIPAFVFGGTQIFPLPASRNITPEVQAGFDSIWVIPESAPVLVVFDYDPALAGEMETLAAPFMDQIILLKHPRLTFLSTSPVGPALAENFFSGLQRQIGNYEGYEPGIGYINLGYLPGGLSGVRAFVQNPLISAPLAFDGSQPWQSEALKDVQAFPHFAEIIVLTDSAESGRTWIEQTELLRGASPLVILASAQAGPLLAPYFESGQVNLLFTGLHDSVLLEQIDAGRPGTARRYWDAYNIGLLFAVVFILGGSLLSFIAGLRERAEARAG